jgi:hypothetical protein
MQNFKQKKTFLSFFKNPSHISKNQRNALFHEKGEREESIFFNYPFDKGHLKNLVCWFYEKHGQYKTLKFLEKLKEVGFGSATNAGLSLGIDDLKIPNQKITLVSTAETKVAKDLLHYRNAKITGIERVQRFIYTWNQTNDTLKQEVVRLFETTDLLNPIYMMAFSGARGNMSQVRQLVGMRGLMSDPQGQIIDFPIQSNFREGLTLTEYLISTYGARKGIVDTALRTATAGYLTRRLVDVAQHTIVSKFDCGTMRGIFLFDMKDGKKTIYSFQNRLIGRVLAQNIEFQEPQILSSDALFFHRKKCAAHYFPTEKTSAEKDIFQSGEEGLLKKIAFRNQEIDSKLAEAISKVTKKAFVRSPLTCETSRFVCQLCYGWSFSHGKLVSVGEAVGIIAAQSIGEPGTQLTMRTFHTGGVFAGGLTDQILAPFDGKIQYFQSIPGSCIRNALSEIAFFTKMPGSFFVEKLSTKKDENFSQFDKKSFENSKKHKKRAEILRIPAYAVLFCRNNEFVKKKQVLAQFSSVLKKMQYGRAEQTLYSTLAGEFVFGSMQQASFSQQNPILQEGASRAKMTHFFSEEKNTHNSAGKNIHTIGQQFLLVEKRRGDFSEVELKNDFLWKSQNWTTVWILSGNIFSDSFNTNFHFHHGDFIKKTSVLKRILWKKNKRYKYFVCGNPKTQKKIGNPFSYFFALEKKKYQSFSCSLLATKIERTPFFQNQFGGYKKSFQNFSKKSKTFFEKKHIQTNFSFLNKEMFFFRNADRSGVRFFTANKMVPMRPKKIFPFWSAHFFQTEKNLRHLSPRFGSSKVLSLELGRKFPFEKDPVDSFHILDSNGTVHSNISFNIFKNIDFLFVQNKSSRFLNDFQRMNLRVPSFHAQTTMQTGKNSKTKKQRDGKMKNHLFFKFLSAQRAKRKKSSSPLFLNGSTFYKTFQISQKFGFFSLSNFSNLSFHKNGLHFFSPFHFYNSKKKIFSYVQKMKTHSQVYKKKRKGLNSFSANQILQSKNHPFFISPTFFTFEKKNRTKNKKENKRKSFKISFFSNVLSSKKTKNSAFFETQTKNILLKKYLLRLPVDKIYYKKFGYISSFSNLADFYTQSASKGKNASALWMKKKNDKNCFQSFSTLTTKENFENSQRNRGQREKFFPPQRGIHSAVGNENFFGKDMPHSLSSCFFEKFRTNTAGIFQFSFFEHDSKKERISSFLCGNFFEHEDKKILFLKPEFLEKNSDSLAKESFSGFSSFGTEMGLTAVKQNQMNGTNNFFLYNEKNFQFSNLAAYSEESASVHSASEKNAENKKENLKKPKKVIFLQSQTLFIFQIPTFSFLSFSTNFFFKPFSFQVQFPKREKNLSLLQKQKEIFQFSFAEREKRKNQMNENKKSFPLSETKLSLPEEERNFIPLISLSEFRNRNKFSENGNKKIFVDTSQNFQKEIFSPVVPFLRSFFEKEKQRKIFTNNPKIQFFDFSKDGDSTKKDFFFSQFHFKKLENFSSDFNFPEKRKQKTFFSDFYEKEILWLPQETFLFFTSEILSHSVVENFSSFQFYSRSDHKPFVLIANNQGKKKNGFALYSHSGQKENLEGFVKIANCKIFQSPSFQIEKKNRQKTILSNSLLASEANLLDKDNGNKPFPGVVQKLSFFSQKRVMSKKKRKSFKIVENKRKEISKKNIVFQFQKKMKKVCCKVQNFQKIQKLFSHKADSFYEFAPLQATQTSTFVRSTVEKKRSGSLHGPKSNCVSANKNLKNHTFFAKKFKNQCFTCLPVLDLFGQNVADFKTETNSKEKSKMVYQNKKYQVKVQQGWIVFPFLNNAILKDHKKIQKKGHFVEKNINFEQNDIVFETVLLEKPFNSFHFGDEKVFFFHNSSKTSGQTKKMSFHANLIQTNKKCRYISFNPSFPFQMNKQSVFFKKESLQTSFFSQRKQKSFMQFFRPFQYKVFENSENSKKLFQNIRIQVFSKTLSSSCFQLFKSYHSSVLNTQKSEKLFSRGSGEKDPNSDFQVWSNFEEMYFSQSVSPFISFSQNTEKVQLKKQFTKKFKFAENQKDNFKKALFSTTSFSQNEAIHFPVKNIFEKNEKKNFFYSFQKQNSLFELQNNFSFYPVQFLPLVLSFSSEEQMKKSKNVFSETGKTSAFPQFSLNVLQNTIEFQLCEKRAPFFEKRFFFGPQSRISDFVESFSFWLHKDNMNFLFSPFSEPRQSKKLFLYKGEHKVSSFKKTQFEKEKKKINFLRTSLFSKNSFFYGSTEFLSPYEGELLPLFTHEMYWWKKASEISTLQKFEKLFTIVTKKDFFSVEFAFEKDLPKTKMRFSLKGKQKHLGKLYDFFSDLFDKRNFIGNSENFHLQNGKISSDIVPSSFKDLKTEHVSNIEKKTKISSFITKYDKKVYTLQNLTVGYPSLFKKPFLGSFVSYGDQFFGSAIQKPGQIIHLGFSSMTVRCGQPCFVSSNGILHFSNIPYIKKNVPLVTLPYQTVQAGDIVQGIPKVEQFFEARTTLQGRLFVSSLPILLKGIFERYKILLPLEQATRQSFLKIQQIIVDGVQRVYRSQGVSITDKHLEVVVRQMTTKVQILHGAQTGFFPGELVNLDLVEHINKFLMLKIRYEPVILGITRASLEVDSFLSASSFQQTTKILSLAAISRKKDFLKGLKENLLVGNLIPSGTGYFHLSKKV